MYDALWTMDIFDHFVGQLYAISRGSIPRRATYTLIVGSRFIVTPGPSLTLHVQSFLLDLSLVAFSDIGDLKL